LPLKDSKALPYFSRFWAKIPFMCIVIAIFSTTRMAFTADLFDYVRQEDYDKIKEALIIHPNLINVKSKEGYSLLHLAAERGNAEIVRLLIEKGAIIDIKHPYGVTPLHLAVCCGYGIIGLDCISKKIRNYENVTKLLISNGADVNAKDKEGNSPLYYIAMNGNCKIAELLISNGADVNAKNTKGITPLHRAVKEGHTQIVEILLLEGADANIGKIQGMTPIKYAKKKGFGDIADLLRKHGAKE